MPEYPIHPVAAALPDRDDQTRIIPRQSDAARQPETPRRRSLSLAFPSNFWTTDSSATDLSVDPSTTAAGEGASIQRLTGIRSLYSGATSFRSRLRSRPKAPSTATSVSSLPVIVRTYSGESSRAGRPSTSGTHRSSSPHSITATDKGKAMASKPANLPPASDFSFDGILRAVEPEISGAIDAIATICARSKLSLADEYAAHRPPHEVLETPIPIPQQQQPPQRLTRWWTVGDGAPLAPLTEASSSSERLAGSGSHRGSSTSSGARKSRKNSAYGSLKSIVSGGEGRGGLTALFGGADAERHQQGEDDWEAGGGHSRATTAAQGGTQWLVFDSGHPAITVASGPVASPHLSLATSDQPSNSNIIDGAASMPRVSSRPLRMTERPEYRRSSSLSSWLPWSRQQQITLTPDPDGTHAEQKLKELLRTP